MKFDYASLVCIVLISAISLSSCLEETSIQNPNDEYPSSNESTTETTKATRSSKNTTVTSAKIAQYDTTQTVSFDKFSVQIPSNFEGIINEEVMGIYSTPYKYQMKLPNGESVFFGLSFEAMYPADKGKFDESASEIAERHQKMYFGFKTEDEQYVLQHPFYLSPTESQEEVLNDCPFIYQTGTMERIPEDGHPIYYYEGYFGSVPYKNRTFNIQQAPLIMIIFTNNQNNEAKEYVHKLIEQVATSFHY